jgi:hypothetical protein
MYIIGDKNDKIFSTGEISIWGRRKSLCYKDG